MAAGTRIHYRITGRPNGAPILFIQGLGADKNGWNLQRLATAPWYRGIALDNRGAGRSGKPHGRYSLEQMADGAIAVLDDASEETAHVVGASMGGAISQIMAVKYPERTRSATLACTAGRTLRGGRSCWRASAMPRSNAGSARWGATLPAG